MVEQHRTGIPTTRAAIGAALVALLALAAMTPGWLDGRDERAAPAPAVLIGPAPPVHEPREWAFWDQMASAFSVQPLPNDLSRLSGSAFRWWFDATYVGAGAAAADLDPTPVDCAGIARWRGEFERYGFDRGISFVEMREGACPQARSGATMG